MKQRTEPTADEILAINADNPQMLFPGDAVAAESEFRRLLKTWHPDRCEEPRATEVTAHLIGLHRLLASQRGANAAAQQGGVVVPWLGPLCIPDPTRRVILPSSLRKVQTISRWRTCAAHSMRLSIHGMSLGC